MAIAAGAPIGACSLFVDTSGFATGDVIIVADGGSSDTGSAAVEASTGDLDAAGASDGATSPCSTAHAFCADFEGAKYQAGWDSIDDQVPGGTLGTGVGANESGTGFRATLPRRDTIKGYAALGKHIQTSFRRVVVDLDMKLDPVVSQTSDSTVGLVCIAFYAGSAQGGTCFALGPSYSPFGMVNGPRVETGRWLHARFELDPVNQTANAVVGGQSYASTWTRPVGQGTQQVFLQLGALGYNVPAPAVAVTYDNVVLDFP